MQGCRARYLFQKSHKVDKIVMLNCKSLKALELFKVSHRSDHQTKALGKSFKFGLTKVDCD